MSVEFSVPLSDIVNDLKLNEVYIAENYEDIKITTVEMKISKITTVEKYKSKPLIKNLKIVQI